MIEHRMQKRHDRRGKTRTLGERLAKDMRNHWMFYLLFLPTLVYYVVFHYVPMYGVQIAFRNYNFADGIYGSPWVGIKHFKAFIEGFYFVRLVTNTFLLNMYELIIGFPAPLILALLLNEVKNTAYKRTVQTITYLPHFISTVVICGILTHFSERDGLFNNIMGWFGNASQTTLLQDPKYFRTIYIGSEIWQGVGWASIIYLAAIAGIDQEQYEAAIIDGAGRFKQVLYITIPNLLNTVIILFILRVGKIMSLGYEKVLLLYNPATWSVSDIISTYTYREGLVRLNYSSAAAVGMINSIVNIVLLLMANWLASKYTEYSLF